MLVKKVVRSKLPSRSKVNSPLKSFSWLIYGPAGLLIGVTILSVFFSILKFTAEKPQQIFFVEFQSVAQEKPPEVKPKAKKCKPITKKQKMPKAPVPEIPPMQKELPEPQPVIEPQPQPDAVPRLPTPVEEEQPVPVYKLNQLPVFKHKAQPIYPHAMRALGKEGKVIVDVHINSQGGIESIRVFQSAGAEFDDAALQAIKASSFSPGLFQDKPVAVIFRIPILFVLK